MTGCAGRADGVDRARSSSSTPARSRPAACSSRCRASGSTGTTTPPPRSRPARSRCSRRAGRRARGVVPPCRTRDRHRVAPGRDRPRRLGRRGARRAGPARRARRRRLPATDRRRRHRLVRQDLDQGPARRRARAARARRSRRPGRSTTSSASRYTVLRADARHPLPGAGDGRPRAAGTSPRCAAVAPPRIGVVLNVGTRAPRRVRLAPRRSPQAKGELVEALPPARRRRRGAQRRRPAGAGDGRAHRGPGGHRRPGRGRRRARRGRRRWTTRPRPVHAGHRRQGAAPVALRLVGAHQVGNALAAAAVALELGMHARRRRRGAVRRPGRVAAGGWRSPSRADGVTVDQRRLQRQPGVDAGRAARRWPRIGRAPADLGGARRDGRAGRRRRGRARRDRPARRPRLGVDRVVVVGAGGGRRRTALPGAHWRESVHVPTRTPPSTLLRRELRPGDVVLVKASRVRRPGTASRARRWLAAGPTEPASREVGPRSRPASALSSRSCSPRR